MPLAAALALVASASGCNLIFGIDEGTAGATGGLGGGGSSSSSSSTGGAGGPTGGTGGTGGSIFDGLALLLHMDEPTWADAGAVLDASGQGNHGTASGSALPTVGGKIGGAGLFDGNGWIVVPDSPTLHAGQELTCAAWVQPTGLTDGTPSPGILSKRQAYAVNVAFTLFLWTDNQAFVDVEADRFHSDGVFANDQWYHVAFVYDGHEAAPLRTRIYVDGVLDSVHASASSSLAPNTEDIQVGGLPGGGEPFVGKLDEVAIWTRALSAAEIASVYEAGLPR